MVRVRHTRSPDSKYVFSRTWTFPIGTRTIDVPAADAFEAVDWHDDLELVADDLPRDWDVLRECAQARDDNGLTGNSPKADIAEWLDSLSAADRAEVLADVDLD